MGTIHEYYVESTAPSTLSERFQEFYANGELLDTTLVCKNGSVRAHKVVIAAQSKFFEDILLHNPCKSPVIVMLDMELETLKCLVDYMYQSKVTLKSTMLENFIKAANILGLNSMIQPVEDSSKDESSQEQVDNVDEYAEGDQESSTADMIQENQLVQVQTLDGPAEDSFVVESGEDVMNHQIEHCSPTTRTIVISNRENFDTRTFNQRARTRIISRKRRFDVVALRQKPSETVHSPPLVVRRDPVAKIEAGMISNSQHATIESLDDTSTLRGDLNVHLKKKHPDEKGQGIIILK